MLFTTGGVQHAVTPTSSNQDQARILGCKLYRIHHAGTHHCEITGETFAIISVATGGNTVGASVEEVRVHQIILCYVLYCADFKLDCVMPIS